MIPHLLKSTFDAKFILKSVDNTVIVTAVTKGNIYENGKRTDKYDHHKYHSVLINNGYKNIRVKIPGDALITNEEIAKNGGSIKVKFKNLTGRYFKMENGELGFTASADGLEVIA